MDALLSVNWIALLVLMIALLSFKALNWIAYRVNWTVVILISMVIGAVIGVVFASEGNTYLVWLNLIGQAYVKLIKALVAPVILVSVISGLISLNDKEKMKKIGTKSVFWLLITSVTAIVVTLVVGAVTNIGKGAGAVFADISSVTDATLSAYQEMETSFDTILLNLVPSNIAADLAADNIVAIIIIAVAVAVAATAATGAIPIPFADAPLLIGEQVTLMATICGIYGMDIGKDGLKMLATTALGAGGATIVGKTIATNLLKFIPGAGTIAGGAISAGTAGVVTLAMGKAFIEVCKLVKLGKLSEKDVLSSQGVSIMKDQFKEQMKRNKK